jgi:alpha-L-rhamnosidase
MKNYASHLNLVEDVKQFDAMAAKVKAAFNEKFYRSDSAYYANNTVTSNLLPLAFGLVPEMDRQKVFDQIVQRTLNMYQGHVSTGLIGGQWLMRGLSDNGRPDLAYNIASHTTYPSWGYMASQGATTIWELWNGNTANPAMNSGNHVMLLGDLLVWFYEYLAGIKSDDKDMAFKTIIMDPYLPPGLTFVKATTSSPYGIIRSSWKKDKGAFIWDIVIPANSKAVIAFPVNELKQLKESNVSIGKAEGLTFLEIKNGKTYMEVGSGRYSFSCPMK